MRYSLPIAILALLGWIIFGGFWQNTNCCGFAGPPLSIKDGATNVAYHANNFIFDRSAAALDLSGAGVKPEVGKLAAYLKSNPKKAVTLTGWYGSDEKNNTKFENLGLGRAGALKNYLVGLGVPAAQILTGGALKNKLNFDKDKLYGGIGYGFSTITSGRSISIKDAAAFSAGTDDNFIFANAGYEYKTPLSSRLKAEFGRTAEYLKKNAKRSLKITGLYSKDEKNTSLLPTLGEARANNIKSLLTGMGVSATQIEIGSRMVANLALNDAKEIINGANYTFFDTPVKSDNRLAEVEKRLKAKPMILYFATNAENLNLSAEQRQYFSDLIYYLDNKKGAKAFSTGHTDSRGDRDLNTRLGRKRAEFVQHYLSRNGISTAQTQAASKGPDQPVSTNDTSEGRQKNRRVEITVN